MKKGILYAGGVMNILLAVGHMFFWKVMNWGVELPRLSPVNSGILQIANIMLIFIMLYFAVMSFIMARRGVSDIFAKSIIICIMCYYGLRLVLGYPFFGYDREELTIWIVCAVIIAGYGTVLIKSKK